MVSRSIVAGLFVLACSAPGQQPNTTAASATWNGVDGPPWPIVATLGATPTGSIVFIVAAGPSQPFAVGRSLGGLIASGIPTSSGLLDLDPGQITIIADGISGTTGSSLDAVAHVGPLGAWTFLVPILPASLVDLGAYQVLVADPLSPSGFTLTAATHLHVFPVRASAIYVSAATGAAGNPGTQAAPLASIADGIAAAVAAGIPYPPVFVTLGTYAESPAFADGVSVHGGLDLTTWTFTGGQSIVDVWNTPASATGITSPTVISGLDFNAFPASTPGDASIACTISGSSAALRFEDCRFAAQWGAAGASGSSGTVGDPGSPGGPGFMIIPCTGQGYWGTGGAGAYSGGYGGQGGLGPYAGIIPGSPGSGPAAGVGGTPGQGGSFPGPSPGGPGGNGGPGSAGANAPSGIAGGTAVNGTWTSGFAPDGSPGDGGSGGGGGGGGGGVSSPGLCAYYGWGNATNIWGGPGGGGGGGGFPGGVGHGGMNGGASFGVYLFDSTPVFSDCAFEAASGGPGGPGGNGAAGGPGGAGGGCLPPCSFCGPGGAPGGTGGQGGAGGPSGGGAGGAGGPSWCIYRGGSSLPVRLGSTSFTVGAGGLRAPGGINVLQQAAPTGPVGPSGTIGP